MKKYIILSFLAALFFTSCEPNLGTYEELDVVYDVPFNEQGLSYALQSADYDKASKIAKASALNAEDSSWASSISSTRSFNTKYPVALFASDLISSNFPALKGGSTLNLTYNQYVGEMYGDILSYELTGTDYKTFNSTVAAGYSFTDLYKPETLLPGFIKTKYPDAVENDYLKITYRYPDRYSKAAQFYKFNGTDWTLVPNSYVMMPTDYAETGVGSQFSESALPNDYLPVLLRSKFPYAQEKSSATIVCEYDGLDVELFAINCVFENSDWTVYFPGKKMTAQFIHTGEAWLFDPTMRFTMVASDFQLIVDYQEAINPDYIDSYGTLDYYTGASSYYSNFDMRLSTRKANLPTVFTEDMTTEEGEALIWKNLHEGMMIFMELKFPEAVPQVEGVDVHYFVSYNSYNDALQHIIYTSEYKCIDTGKFEFIEVTEPE